jgi:hypothetical protein
MDRLSAIFCGETIFRGAEGHLLTARRKIRVLSRCGKEKKCNQRPLKSMCAIDIDKQWERLKHSVGARTGLLFAKSGMAGIPMSDV